MKKIFCVLMTILLLSINVSADILWEPFDNDYYWDHYQQAATVAAVYEVPEGMTVNIYTAPVNGTLIKTLEEDTAIYVGFSLKEDGEVWATGYPLGDFDTEGWFRLGRLQKQYSHIEFINDYADQIAAEEAWLVASEVGGTIYTWTYPGSGVSDGILEEELLSSGSEYNDGKVSYGLVYTDPEGGRWGYIGYHMGHVGWMYLDDPTDPDPALKLHPKVVSTVTDTSPTEDMTAAPAYGKVFAAVGIVVAAAALLIVHIRKKQK